MNILNICKHKHKYTIYTIDITIKCPVSSNDRSVMCILVCVCVCVWGRERRESSLEPSPAERENCPLQYYWPDSQFMADSSQYTLLFIKSQR